jgi:hypothetical protein
MVNMGLGEVVCKLDSRIGRNGGLLLEKEKISSNLSRCLILEAGF